jgi:3-hydroxybutyryl-CoA dehydrogenase
MGSGIAQIMASAGFEVVIWDLSEEFVKKGIAAIERNLGYPVQRNGIHVRTERDDNRLKNISNGRS